MRSKAASYATAAAVAFGAFGGLLACKPKATVITREDSLAKEDAAIKVLQEKVAARQEELDKLERERRKESEKLAAEQRQKRNEAIRKYEEFLAKYPISPYTPDVLIALGELYLERSEEENARALDEYQRRLEEAQANGLEFNEPEPQPHYEKTIAAYQQIALKYKDYPYADVAYYGLGYCLKAQGEDKEAAETFYKLTQLYPESKFVPEAYFRIGEYFFDQYEFDKAVKYYALVPPDNPDFYDKALYKMGWAYYNQGDIGVSSVEYQKAIDAFTKLIEVSEKKSNLTKEAMEFTAISLTEWSSDPNDETAVTKALAHYEENFGANKGRDYSPEVLHELGNVYLYKQDKLKAATTTYETLLQTYPKYGRAPEVLDSLVECYLRQEDYEGAHKTRIRIVDGYGPGSEWFKSQEDIDVQHRALQRWEQALYDVAVYYNTQAERKSRAKPEEAKPLYQEAINRYNQYLAAFPTNARAYHVNFYLASSYDAIGDYANAGDQYQKTALGYTDRERYEIDKWDEKFTQEDALFNAIVAYGEIFDRDREAEKAAATGVPAETPPATTDNGVAPLGPVNRPVKPMTLDEANLVRACNAFVDRYPESKQTPMVLGKLGDVYFYVEDYDKAREAYQKLVTKYTQAPDPATQKEHDQLYVYTCEAVANSYFNEAQFYEKHGDYVTAGEKYNEAKKWYTRTEREAKDRGVLDTVDRAKKLAGATGIKTAEMKGAGVKIEAIEEPTISPELAVKEEGTEDFTVLYPPLPPIEPSAFAAKSAEAREYEANAAENQGNEVGQLSLGNAAETYYKIRDWDNAARTYLQFTRAYPQAGDATRVAYTKAAECYERKQDWANAAKIYLEIADHPQYKGTPLGVDALFRAGLLYEQQKDWGKAAEVFDRFIKEYPEDAKARLEATFRLARAQERSGRMSEALENYKICAAIYKAGQKEGLDMSGTEKFAAEALFKHADTKFAEYDAIQFVMPQKVMEANLKKKMEQFQNLGAYYIEVANMGIPKWAVAAHCRTGDLCISFRDALRNAEVPKELTPEYWEALPDDDPRKPLLEEAYYKYTEELENQAAPLEDKAIAEYTEAVNIAEAEGVDTEWSRKAYQQLLAIRPAEVVKYEDIGNQGLKSDTTWLVSNTAGEGWLTLKYDDSGWGTAQTSAWREKDEMKVVERVPGDVATIWGAPLDEVVYFRKKISFTYNPGHYDAVIQVNGQYKLYVNGKLIGQSDPLANEPWVKPDTYDVTDALALGDNVICIEATRLRKDSYGLRFALVPEGGFPQPAPPEGEGATPPEFGETGVPEEFGGERPEEGTLPEGEMTPPAEGGGETQPAETPRPAEGGEPLPAPGGEENGSGETGSSPGGETIDFGNVGTPEEMGAEPGAGEQPAGGEEF